MKDIFQVSIEGVVEEKLQVLFDDKDRAERFVGAINEVLTDEARKEVKFVFEVLEVVDSDIDVANSFKKLGKEKK